VGRHIKEVEKSLDGRLGSELLLQEASSGVTGHKPRRVAFVTQEGETILSFASAESKGSGNQRGPFG